MNASRALPTFGIMVLLYIWIAPHFTGKTNLPYILPVEFVLLLLAIPPLLSNTYAGVQSVDPAMRDAAYGMGMTGRQVLVKVELPNAFPLMMSGLRASTLQVVATATIGAYIGLGGLGAPIYEGTQQGPFQDTRRARSPPESCCPAPSWSLLSPCARSHSGNDSAVLHVAWNNGSLPEVPPSWTRQCRHRELRPRRRTSTTDTQRSNADRGTSQMTTIVTWSIDEVPTWELHSPSPHKEKET